MTKSDSKSFHLFFETLLADNVSYICILSFTVFKMIEFLAILLQVKESQKLISSLNYIQFHYSCNTMKKNPRPLRILEVGFKSKKLDISIIIWMNENIEIPDKSTINEKSICHHPTRLDDYIGIAYTCF